MANAIIMGAPGRRTVDEASLLLKRMFFVEKEVMRTLGGYLVSISNWELKKLVPRHLWEDSLRANALRTRVLEMRYPRKDVDTGNDPLLEVFTSMLIRCQNDREFIEGAYFVAKKALKTAYEMYLKDSEPLDDAPTIAFMKTFSNEIQLQLNDVQDLFPTLLENHPGTSLFLNKLNSFLQDIGGVIGLDNQGLIPEKQEDLLNRSKYVSPLVPVRDPRFEEALYHMPPQFVWYNLEKLSFIEHQVCMAINHVNEMWACEATGTLMWQWNDMPWEFFQDTARWCYDELRHCMMGEKRLKAWGFEIGVDHAMVGDHYISQSEHGELAILGLIHYFESNSPEWKSGLVREFTEQGDTGSAQDFDYDWADESIHMQYGHKWLMHKLNNNIDAKEDLMEVTSERWNDWLKKAHAEWNYEPFASRIRHKINEIEAKYHGDLSN
jgi:hypothetical protein